MSKDFMSMEAVDLLREIVFYERRAEEALERLADLALDVEQAGGSELRELLSMGLVAPFAKYVHEPDLHTPLTMLTASGRRAAKTAETTIGTWRP